MEIFLILQILFDAVLLFGLLFLFHFSVHQFDKKKEEWDILKNVQVQEIRENLQELLMTLKQLGKEVSDNIQEQVRTAEEKTEGLKKIVSKLNKDLNKVTSLAEEIAGEKIHLENKMGVIQTAKKNAARAPAPPGKEAIPDEESRSLKGLEKEKDIRPINVSDEDGVGFSSGVIREVYRLADEKLKLSEIVQKTELTRAEVQLILNLRENRFSTPN